MKPRRRTRIQARVHAGEKNERQTRIQIERQAEVQSGIIAWAWAEIQTWTQATLSQKQGRFPECLLFV
jgi:hypothetical protein